MVPEEGNKIYRSSNTHHFTGTKLHDGKEFYTDGGREYCRRMGDFDLLQSGRVIDLCLYEGDEFSTVIAHKLCWGTYGKTGSGPLTYKLVKDCDLDHLQAILDTQSAISPIHRLTVKYWVDKKRAALSLKAFAPSWPGFTATAFISGVVGVQGPQSWYNGGHQGGSQSSRS